MIGILVLLIASCTSNKQDKKSKDGMTVDLQEEEGKEKPGKNKKTDFLITIETPFGEMKAILYDQTPEHKENFIKLAEDGFYDGTTFHRVIKGFMIQGGDPNSKDGNPSNNGTGGPGYTIPAEIKPELKHNRGAIAAARTQNPEKRSSGSQFYIVHNDKGAKSLDGQYTVFGQVIDGLEVIDKIAEQKTVGPQRSQPEEEIPMTVTVKEMKKKKIEKETGYSYE